MIDRIRALLPRANRVTPGLILIAGSVAVLLALLSNSPGMAIVLASLLIPAVALVELPRRDAYENEPRWSSPAMVLWGIGVGIVTGVIASFVASEWWIKGAALHAGASGFGGSAADLAGRPGAGVLLINGVLVAAAAIALAAFGPYLLRRYPVFRNEVMDGVTLGAAAGAGLATGTTIVAVMPLLNDDRSSGGSVADWSAMLLGLLVTRPIIFGIAVALVCAGLWRTSLTARSIDLGLPMAVGLGGVVVFWIGDLIVQPSGTRPELIWHLMVAAGMAVAARLFVASALAFDRTSAGVGTGRTVCPVCRSSTPAGAFCAVCGSSLNGSPVTGCSDSTEPVETIETELVVADPDDLTTPIEQSNRTSPPS